MQVSMGAIGGCLCVLCQHTAPNPGPLLGDAYAYAAQVTYWPTDTIWARAQAAQTETKQAAWSSLEIKKENESPSHLCKLHQFGHGLSMQQAFSGLSCKRWPYESSCCHTLVQNGTFYSQAYCTTDYLLVREVKQ